MIGICLREISNWDKRGRDCANERNKMHGLVWSFGWWVHIIKVMKSENGMIRCFARGDKLVL